MGFKLCVLGDAKKPNQCYINKTTFMMGIDYVSEMQHFDAMKKGEKRTLTIEKT